MPEKNHHKRDEIEKRGGASAIKEFHGKPKLNLRTVDPNIHSYISVARSVYRKAAPNPRDMHRFMTDIRKARDLEEAKKIMRDYFELEE